MLFLIMLVISCQASKNESLKNIKNNGKMNKVLIIGMNPKTIDFSNSELPPNVTLETIENGTQNTLKQLENLGYKPQLFLIDTGSTDLRSLSVHLQSNQYHGILIGNGIRGIKSNFLLFENVVNTVHQHAPLAKIIFNTNPSDTIESVQRWM